MVLNSCSFSLEHCVYVVPNTSVSADILTRRAQQLLRWATVWSQGMGRKWGGAAVRAGSPLGPQSPSNTMWPGPTSLPSGILIYPTVWPQL